VIFDPVYLLLKVKRLAKAYTQVVKDRKRLILGNTLRGLAVITLFIFFLSVGTRQPVPENGDENVDRKELAMVGPTLLVGSPSPPKITARSAYLIDLKSGFILYDKNSSRKLPPASTTKIATALVALDDYKLGEVVEVHPSCILRTGESIVGLYSLEKITVRNLLRAMLIASASDAACALARYHRKGVVGFVKEMNKLAANLTLEWTHFVNPSGLDESLHYSTARDLTTLAKEAIKKRFIREVVKTKKIDVASVDEKHWYSLEATNELLGKMRGILGVKTGQTPKARGVFIFYFKRGERELLGTVMGSKKRFGETKALLKWVLSSFIFP